MNDIRVSVLIPVWNAQDTISTALDSILRQSCSSFEVVVVDDGSTDRTPEILAAYAGSWPFLRVITIPHSGIVSALNTGLAACSGDYIARMDADDVAMPSRLMRQAAFLDENIDIGLVGCVVRFGGEKISSGGYARYVDWTNSLFTSEQIALERFRESPFAHPSVMFRASLVPQFGGYAEGCFPEDYELWLRWLEEGVRMARLPTSVQKVDTGSDGDDALLVWNDPPNRLSRTDERCSVENFYEMKSAYLFRWLAINNPSHPHVTVIGAGKMSRRRALLLRAHGVVIDAWVDVDPKKIGNIVDGVRVVGREALPAKGQGFCLAYLAGHGAAEELEDFLASLEYEKGKDYLLVS